MILIALSDANSGALSESELASKLGRQTRSVSDSMSLLQRRDLVSIVESHERSGPSTPARRWALTGDGQRRLTDLSIAGLPRGRGWASGPTLEAGQSFLSLQLASSQLPSLLELLAERQLAAEAQAIARLDGEGHTFLFLYQPGTGAQPAERLAAELAERELPFLLGTVSGVRSPREFLARETRAESDASPMEPPT